MSSSKITGFVQRSTGAHKRSGYKTTRRFLENDFQSEWKDYACGIYEWKIKKGKKEHVVYIGSTCMDAGDFITRIMQYCTNGSHLSDFIENALQKKHDLYVRFKGACGKDTCKQETRDDERKALKKYDYAWNTENQPSGHTRTRALPYN